MVLNAQKLSPALYIASEICRKLREREDPPILSEKLYERIRAILFRDKIGKSKLN